jgi:cation diffusion facilitator CzcD-associated flavoprotein CzcO
VGAGFGGLGMAARLLSTGERNFMVLERADDVGGVWRDNVYPGCRCEIPSHFYAFSFAPNPYWKHTYATQLEIQAYLQSCARRFGILPHVRFGHEVIRASWQEDCQRWHIETGCGTFVSEVLVCCTGLHSDPQVPTFEGIEAFDGKVMHSARWDRGWDLRGKRVAVVGTGASAIQIIPEIQPFVEKLVVFQRTPPWVARLGNRSISASAHRLFAAAPFVQRLVRWLTCLALELLLVVFRFPSLTRYATELSRRRIERKVADPALRKKVTPDYLFGCRHILRSDSYLSCLTKANVEIVTDAIREIGRNSIVTVENARYDVDTIVLATGFLVFPIARVISGRGGLTLAESWNGCPQAHVGTTVSGFPGLFLLLGPNGAVAHSSELAMIEAQIARVLSALRYMKRRDLVAVEPLPTAQSAFVAEVDRKMRRTVWKPGGCSTTYFVDRSGRNFAFWPGFIGAFRRRVTRFDCREYSAIPRRDVAPEVMSAPSREAARQRIRATNKSWAAHD